MLRATGRATGSFGESIHVPSTPGQFDEGSALAGPPAGRRPASAAVLRNRPKLTVAEGFSCLWAGHGGKVAHRFLATAFANCGSVPDMGADVRLFTGAARTGMMHRRVLRNTPLLVLLCWVGSAAADQSASAAGGDRAEAHPVSSGSTGASARASRPKRALVTDRASGGNAEGRPALLEPSWSVPAVHALGLMTTMRVTEAVLWPDPFADTRLDRIGGRYEAAFTRPPVWDSRERPFEWDGDPWIINVVGHGLFGSELYLRARMCRHDVGFAVAFAAASSAVWEYGFEANGVRPSALDLMYTPVAGLLLGELRLWLWRIGTKSPDPGWGRVLSWVVDPLGEIERAAGSGC